MNMVAYVFDTVLNTLVTMSYRVMGILPEIIAAGVLLLMGAFIARWLRYLVEQMLGYVQADHLCERVEINHLLHRLGVGRSPTKIAGFSCYWVVFLGFLLSAAEVLHLPVVGDFLRQAAGFLPHLVSAVLIMGGGLILGRFFGGIVTGAALANHVPEADFLGQGTYWAMVIFSGLAALGRLGIDVSILGRHPHIVLGAIGLGCAIAFGFSYAMGGKPVPRLRMGPKVDHILKIK